MGCFYSLWGFLYRLWSTPFKPRALHVEYENPSFKILPENLNLVWTASVLGTFAIMINQSFNILCFYIV